MPTLNDRFLKNWSDTRRLGIKRYMLMEGSIFGVLVFVITRLISLWEVTIVEAFFTSDAFYMLVWYEFGGIFVYAPVMWWYNERMYQKHIDTIDDQSTSESDS
jgi:hypothetical protein